MKYKALIFDCDGVLVDSEAISNQIIVEMSNANGASIDLAYAIEHFAGTSLHYVMNHIENLIGRKLPENFVKEYRRICAIRFQTHIQPIVGIKEVLKQLTVPFCVASNGTLEKMDLNLRLTGLSDFFRGKMFSAYEINAWKPDPQLFLWAAKTMGFDPSECAVVEDSMSGVQAGIAGGFDVFAFCHSSKKSAFEQLGVSVFSQMNELLPLLKKA